MSPEVAKALYWLPFEEKPLKRQYIGNIHVTETPIGTIYRVYPLAKRAVIGHKESSEKHDIITVYVIRPDDPTDDGGYFPAVLFEEMPS